MFKDKEKEQMRAKITHLEDQNNTLRSNEAALRTQIDQLRMEKEEIKQQLFQQQHQQQQQQQQRTQVYQSPYQPPSYQPQTHGSSARRSELEETGQTKKEYEKITEINEQLRKEVSRLDTKLVQKENQIAELDKEVKDLTNGNKTAVKMLSEWEAHAKALEKQRTEAESKTSKWKSDAEKIPELQRKIEELKADTYKYKNEAFDLRRKTEDIESTSTRRAIENDELRKETNELRNDNNKHRGEINALQKKISELESTIRKLEKEISDLRAENTKYSNNINDLKRKNEDQDAEIRKHVRDNNVLGNENTKYREENRELSATKRKQIDEINDLKENISKIKGEMGILQTRLSKAEQELVETRATGAILQANVDFAKGLINTTSSKVKSTLLESLLDVLTQTILREHEETRNQNRDPLPSQTSRDSSQNSYQNNNNNNNISNTNTSQINRERERERERGREREPEHIPEVRSSYSASRNIRYKVKVPVFCSKNASDIPDVIDIFNEYGTNLAPSVTFQLQQYDTAPDGGPEMLAVVLALCSTDRVDIVDKELLEDLREKKGCAEVLMIILRRGNDPSKFKPNHDNSIRSGVKTERALFQLVHFKGKVLMDADTNKNAVNKFFDFVKLAIPNVN